MLTDISRPVIEEEDSSNSTTINSSRRNFLVRSVAGGGLMLGCAIPDIFIAKAYAQSGPSTSSITAWIIIGSDESITIQVPATEVGQGTMTGLAQIVADELRVAWSNIKVVHAPIDAMHGGQNAGPYGRFTGGSLSIRLFSAPMQQTAANARQMLITAAANSWSISPSACSANLGVISATVGGVNRSTTYGAVAQAAATLPTITNTPLNQYPKMYVGTSQSRVDIPNKVNGQTKYGIDIFLPGMVFASVKHCPTVGGKVGALGSTPRNALASIPVGAIGTPGTSTYVPANGVAVIAATTWEAMQAARQVNVNWTLPTDLNAIDSTAISARAAWLMTNGAPLQAANNNAAAIPAALAAGTSISAQYQLPYLPHAHLEPLSCTVFYQPGSPARCDMWVPTQVPDAVLQLAKALCPAGTVFNIINTMVGGAFGRRLEIDFVREAIQVGLAAPGKPVKLTWSREQEFANDQYRPMALSSIQAAASATNGKITAWSNRIVTPSISVQRGADPSKVDGSAVQGANDLPYDLNPLLVEYIRHDSPIPVGYLRSVGHSINTFAVESAMDELAHAIGWDPIQFRLNNLSNPRLIRLLNALKTLSNWGSPSGNGHAQGVAIVSGFGSYVGQVAEVSLSGTNVRVNRISTVIDCGMAVNPDAIKAQIEGAVIQATATTLYLQQTFTKGVAQVSNYNKYRFLRGQDTPKIDVQIIANGDPIGGVGEPGVPCVAPAIANAHARLTGQPTRFRSLPFYPGTRGGEL